MEQGNRVIVLPVSSMTCSTFIAGTPTYIDREYPSWRSPFNGNLCSFPSPERARHISTTKLSENLHIYLFIISQINRLSCSSLCCFVKDIIHFFVLINKINKIELCWPIELEIRCKIRKEILKPRIVNAFISSFVIIVIHICLQSSIPNISMSVTTNLSKIISHQKEYLSRRGQPQ